MSTRTDVDVGTGHAQPAPRSPDIKAALEYLVASGVPAITIIEIDGVCSPAPLPIKASTGDRWRSAESAEAKITLANSTARNSDGMDDGKERLPQKINALLQAFTTAIDD
jgi:hypothetical protein